LYVADADGSHPRRLTRTVNDEYGLLVWTQDATAVLYSDGNLYGARIRAVDLGGPCRAPVALSGVDIPPPLDESGWDFRGGIDALHLGC